MLVVDRFLTAKRQRVETLSKPVNETEKYGGPVTDQDEDKRSEEDRNEEEEALTVAMIAAEDA